MLGLIVITPAVFASDDESTTVLVDPDKALAVSSSLTRWKNAGNIYKIEKQEGPDLDLGFNDCLELHFQASGGHPSPVIIKYGTTDPASSNILRELVISTNSTLCNGNSIHFKTGRAILCSQSGKVQNISRTASCMLAINSYIAHSVCQRPPDVGNNLAGSTFCLQGKANSAGAGIGLRPAAWKTLIARGM